MKKEYCVLGHKNRLLMQDCPSSYRVKLRSNSLLQYLSQRPTWLHAFYHEFEIKKVNANISTDKCIQVILSPTPIPPKQQLCLVFQAYIDSQTTTRRKGGSGERKRRRLRSPVHDCTDAHVNQWRMITFHVSNWHTVRVVTSSAGKGEVYVILWFTNERIRLFLEINVYQEPSKWVFNQVMPYFLALIFREN